MPGVGVDLKDAVGRRHRRTTTTDAQRPVSVRSPQPGQLQVCFQAAHAALGLRLHAQGRARLDARKRLGRGHDGCTDTISLAAGQRDLDWDAGIWKAPAPPSGGGSSGAVSGKPKLALKKTGKPATVRAGNSVRYTLTVSNIGKATARDVEVCDTLPKGVTVTSTGSGKLSGAQVCWTVGNLAKGKHKQFTLTVKVDLTRAWKLINNAVATASNAPRREGILLDQRHRARGPPRGRGRDGLTER